MYTYLKPVDSSENLLTLAQIMDLLRDKYDICSKGSGNTPAMPKKLIRELLSILNDEAGNVLYRYQSQYMVQRVFTDADKVEAVLQKLDCLLDENTALVIEFNGNEYLITRAAVEYTQELKETSPHIGIHDLI